MRIVKGIDNEKIDQISDILYDSFSRKLNIIIDDKMKACNIIKKSINSNMGFYALDDNDEVIGVLGTVTNVDRFNKLKFKSILKEYSFLKTLIKYIPLKIESMKIVKKNEVYINLFAVKKGYRGRGIGSELLNTITSHFKETGYKYLRLTVINTNTGAKKMYEKHGFSLERETKYGFLTKKAGFTSVYHMRKEL
ncbi:MAG: GNAT family N-acetyltransferase [Bacillota bacterium]|nr:GNAT family N-acetyltransferase [Bacillota bacterium]